MRLLAEIFTSKCIKSRQHLLADQTRTASYNTHMFKEEYPQPTMPTISVGHILVNISVSRRHNYHYTEYYTSLIIRLNYNNKT